MRDARLVLMDIDPATLARTERHVRDIIAAHELPARVEATTDRRAALAGADFVVACFAVGGIDALALDVEIPRRYGIDQTVGDTLGPGGIFRGLRSMHALEPICADMREVCPGALLIQYANPMSINCWFTSGEGIDTIGLCHSVEHTADFLANLTGARPGTWSFRAAGINHQAWVLEYRVDGRDAMDDLRAAVRAYARGEREAAEPVDELVRRRPRTGAGRDHGRHRLLPHRVEPPQLRVPVVLPPHAGRGLVVHRATVGLPGAEPRQLAGRSSRRWPTRCARRRSCRARSTPRRSPTRSSRARPRVVYGNVPNGGLITNLPAACCVEVPCLVDAAGVQPTRYGALPAACAGMNLGSIAVQACTVEAYRTRSRDAVHAAVALDRLTSAILTLDEVHRMTDELLAAHAPQLPAFS